MSDVQNHHSLRSTGISTMPPGVRVLLGERPLINGESPDEYDDMLGMIAEAVNPANFFEWTWVKDFADAAWEVHRARRARTKLLEALLTADPYGERQFGREDAELAKAEGYLHALATLQPIDRTIAAATARRDSALREVDRRRFEITRRHKLEALILGPAANDDRLANTTRSLPSPNRA